jgi:charged multivesicular body protein 3
MAAGKARQSVKQLAKKGDVKSARILAREVVRSDRQKDRLSVTKARLGSIGTQLSQQMGKQSVLLVVVSYTSAYRTAMVKVTGSLQKSTEIMKLSNALIRLPQISQTMREMSMEMTKVRVLWVRSRILFMTSQAGVMEEMLDDTLDMDEDQELEEEADAEVDKVLFEITNGKLGEAGSVGVDLPVSVVSIFEIIY